MTSLIWVIGAVLVIEGLALALAPRRIEEALDLLRSLSPDTRRAWGLGALAAGVALIWLARLLG